MNSIMHVVSVNLFFEPNLEVELDKEVDDKAEQEGGREGVGEDRPQRPQDDRHDQNKTLPS